MVGAIWSGIGFLLIGSIFWGLIILSGIYFLHGLLKKSWKSFLISGVAMIIPAITLATQKGYFILFLFLPLFLFVASLITRLSVRNNY